MLVKPREIVKGANPDETNGGKVSLGSAPIRSFHFGNDSPYYVYIRYDWREHILDVDPHVFLDPWSRATTSHPEGTQRLCYMAAADLGEAANPNNATPKFWFAAHERNEYTSVPAFPMVGITDAPEQAGGGVADVSKVVNDDAALTSFVTGKLEADAVNRIMLKNDGDLFAGLGATGPTQVWEIETGGVLKYLTLPRSAVTPTLADQLTRKGYVDAGDALGVLKAGDTMTGQLSLVGDPTANAHAARKAYVDNVNNIVDTNLTLGANWGVGTLGTAPKIRQTGKVVQCTGFFKNNSGSSNAPGTRIFTVPAAYRPIQGGRFVLPRLPSTGAWLTDTCTPVILIGNTGEVEILAAVGNDAYLDVSPLSWITE